MSGKQFFVVGGEYADTSFTRLVGGDIPERHGPFASEHQAHEVWRSLTGRSVDEAMVRYVIETEALPGSDEFFVVGGEYADTSFTRMAEGRELESYGPFKHGQAMDFWRGITSQTVDSATHRYDIVSASEMDKVKASA